MVKHIVLYTLKEGTDKEKAVEIIKNVLEPLPGKIPGLTHLEIRAAYQVVWTMPCTLSLRAVRR